MAELAMAVLPCAAWGRRFLPPRETFLFLDKPAAQYLVSRMTAWTSLPAHKYLPAARERSLLSAYPTAASLAAPARKALTAASSSMVGIFPARPECIQQLHRMEATSA